MKGVWLFLLLFVATGCSAGPKSTKSFSQNKNENDAFLCEKETDARLGGRGVPEWQRAYDECMITGGQ
jgi:hypothetical protein